MRRMSCSRNQPGRGSGELRPLFNEFLVTAKGVSHRLTVRRDMRQTGPFKKQLAGLDIQLYSC